MCAIDAQQMRAQTRPVLPPSSVKRLVDAVRDRMDELALDQEELASQGGPSESTLRKLFAAARSGVGYKDFQFGTYRKFDKGLQWEQGSTDDVLRGGQPRPLPGSGPGVRVVSGHDPELGEWQIGLPREHFEGLTPAERDEVQAHMIAEGLARARKILSQKNPPPA